jgi:hypothetical protein
VRLQVVTVVSMKMTAFWDIAPCSLIEVDSYHLKEFLVASWYCATDMRIRFAVIHFTLIKTAYFYKTSSHITKSLAPITIYIRTSYSVNHFTLNMGPTLSLKNCQTTKTCQFITLPEHFVLCSGWWLQATAWLTPHRQQPNGVPQHQSYRGGSYRAVHCQACETRCSSPASQLQEADFPVVTK